jgi:hypothetical protein
MKIDLNSIGYGTRRLSARGTILPSVRRLGYDKTELIIHSLRATTSDRLKLVR